MLYSSCNSCKLVSLEHHYTRQAYLTSSVNDLRQVCLAFVDDLMTERILDGGIVALDKVAFAVLYS
jgi:hypothetical protein